MRSQKTIGVYAVFPEKCHYACRIELMAPIISAKKALLSTLFRLNGHIVEDETLKFLAGPDIEVILEFGVANEFSFEYLDSKILDSLIRAVDEEIIHKIDFLCVARYYRRGAEKRTALRFDFYLLRFSFDNEGWLGVQALHERGLQRIPVEELVDFLIKEMRSELSAGMR